MTINSNRKIHDERLSVVTAPTILPITLAEIGRQLAMSSEEATDHQEELEAIAELATSQYENDTQIVLCETTYLWTLPHFYAEKIYFPKRPVTAIDFIKYYDGGEVLQTISSSDYELVSNIDRFHPGSPFFQLKWNKDWPSTHSSRYDAVQIQFKAGFANTQAGIPTIHKSPIKLLCTYYFETRGETTSVSLDHNKAYESLVNRFLSPRY